jgi:hypothetical protein
MKISSGTIGNDYQLSWSAFGSNNYIRFTARGMTFSENGTFKLYPTDNDAQYARAEAFKQNKTITFQFSSGANWCYGIDDNAAGCDCTAGARASNCTVVACQNAGVNVSAEKIV